MDSELEVVNVVGSGAFDTELDLHNLAQDLGDVATYNPDEHTGMHVRIETGDLVTVYRTGSYHIVGGKSEEGLFEARDDFLSQLEALDVQVNPDADGFEARNFVCTGDFSQPLNLNAVAIGFGLENVEYEPEQFPGLVYRPPEFECVLLLFPSGKTVVTGSANTKTSERAFTAVAKRIQELFGDV